MKTRWIIASLLIGATFVSQAAQQAKISFADLGGIRDWQADGDSALYVEGRNNRWYYATLKAPCMDLPFEDRIGFVVEPYGNFDRWSSILVRGHECVLGTLNESSPPPTEK